MSRLEKKKLLKDLQITVEYLTNQQAWLNKNKTGTDLEIEVKAKLDTEINETKTNILKLEQELREAPTTKTITKEDLERKITSIEKQIDELDDETEMLDEDSVSDEEYKKNLSVLKQREAKIKRLEKQAQKLRDLRGNV